MFTLTTGDATAGARDERVPGRSRPVSADGATPRDSGNRPDDLELIDAGQAQAEGAGALVGQLEAKCITKLERKIQMRGKIVYAEYAKCVTAATTLSDAERC